MKKLLILLTVLGTLMGTTQIFADSYLASIPTSISCPQPDCPTNGYTNIGAIVPISQSNLISQGFLNTDATNSQVIQGSTARAYMPTSDNLFAYVATAARDSTQTYSELTGYSPSQTNFAIVPGYNGEIATNSATNIKISSAVIDNFTGTEGINLTTHTTDTGQSWTATDTHWSIASNKAKYDATSADQAATVDSALTSFTMQADLTISSTDDKYAGFVFRFTDLNNYDFLLFAHSGGQIHWYSHEVTAGSHSNLGSGAFAGAAGATITVRIIVSGNTITYYANGASINTVTNSARASVTAQGLLHSETGASDQRWDNLHIGPASWLIEQKPYFDATKTSGNILRKEGTYFNSITAAGQMTALFYPDATLSQNGNSADAYITKSNAVYATAQAAATGDSVTNGASLQISNTLSGGTYTIDRSFLFFDTSSLIPPHSEILTANLQLYFTAKTIGDGDFNMRVQNGQPTHPSNPVVTSDYDATFYSGDGGDYNTANVTLNQYSNISLNSTAISWLNQGGTTKLAFRIVRDINAAVPAAVNTAVFDSATGAHPPVLIVVYANPTAVSAVKSGISSGEHAFAASYDGTQLSLTVDGGSATSTSTSSFPYPTSNQWLALNGNSAPYLIYEKITKNGTLTLNYQPASIAHITGTFPTYTLADISGGGNNGTINAGANPTGLTISAGSLIPYSYSTADLSNAENTPGYAVNGVPSEPSHLHNPSSGTTIFGLNIFAGIAPGAGYPVDWLLVLLVVILITAVAVILFFFIPHPGVTAVLVTVLLAIFGIQGPLPFWPVILYPLMATGILVADRGIP